ncbi:M13 family metallopeptidase [Anaerocolumna sp. AGMB13025]|uniref:M13 family metallopeptidase n=1 Tax=Anaerocolumna sp. AGMB13025 TaxID=3039116 RepID=UPI0024204026|nr:M13 family metallopeptidase [Anaerocolumna sp. AGMB13025]WFR57638.1 M13 family metallopeptidase [Anaerocolumna sp. AGMB13025]
MAILKDDFYTFINEKWLNSARIHNNNKVNSVFQELKDNQIQILTNLLKGDELYSNTFCQVKFFYRCILDSFKNSSNETNQLYHIIHEIEMVNNLNDLILLANGFRIEFDLIQVYIEPNIYNNEVNSIYLCPPNIPDFNNDQRAIYKEYLMKNYLLIGYTYDSAKEKVENTLILEEKLSNYCDDVDCAFQYSDAEFRNRYCNKAIGSIINNVRLHEEMDIVTYGTKWLEFLNEYFVENNLTIIKNFIETNTLKFYIDYIGGKFKEYKDKYDADLYGEVSKSSDEFALHITNKFFGNSLGILYASIYHNEHKLELVNKITEDIIQCYITKLNNVDWLSAPLKKHTIIKLRKMKRNIGCLEQKDLFHNLDLINNNYNKTIVENIILYKKYLNENMNEIPNAYGEETYSTNTSYDFNTNSINIPLGLINGLLTENYRYEELLATIGFLIGHEIAHSFDSNGLTYDYQGNFTENIDDNALHNKKLEELVLFYNGMSIIEDLKVDGQLTLQENFADNCAMRCMLDLLNEYSNADFDLFFRTFASTWRIIYKESYLYNLIPVDEHLIYKLRVNGVLKNNEEFYKTYNISINDKMYIDKTRRITLW